MKTFVKLTALSLLMSSATAIAYETDKVYQFTVLHTNDLHGHFWPNERGEYGLAAQKTLIDKIRTEVETKGGTVLLLNAGDINTGVPESDLQNARPDIEGMNVIGYDAMTLGNHEFDNPLQLLEMQEKWAKFPFLAANVRLNKTNELLVKPYTVLDKQGLKIAVVGLTTEDTAKLGNPEFMGAVTFNDPTETAKQVLAQLDKNEKPDVKIALTHMGYYSDGKHGSNAPGDVSMVRNLPLNAFDMVIGGHTHDTVCVDEKGKIVEDYAPTQACKPDFQNGTWIMQAGEWGKYVGRADFEFKNGELNLVDYTLIPVNLKQKTTNAEGKSEYVLYENEIPQDAQLMEQLKAYQDKGDELLGVKVGEVKGKLEGDRKVVRFHQTNLGHLIGEAQRERVNADFAIVGSGGIRDSILEGDVTYKDILKVQPFGNILTYFELKGRDLLDYLNVVAFKEVDSGAYPQFSRDISMIVDLKNKQLKDIKIQNQDFDPNKVYRIAILSYWAAGGDGYPVVTNHPTYVNTGFVDAEVLKEFFIKNSPIDAHQFEPNNAVVFQE
ncbi:bifunctional UDP-sugar hydrolase/5'-nucleotidase UshA [Conservatibacter flavescens]|uniref:Bifunctional UDP-sugar hydrolase/5'-nucleotidase n=1 Tax=Conservatibacter flavescens TaxID=28161 RepID=A0A2M8S342_9PAST|nr:bifunctional UDP-sugar hydrolase/5'-nucleotidase UshA [Conservatibacter flavescens]PJG85559.1 bifunctional UDP-sugar hydrolase/5'-nucleotidase [Conservatibacter flavescens]